MSAATTGSARPSTVLGRRWQKFRSFKRGWWSFLLLLSLYAMSMISPLLITNKALVVRHQGSTYFPALGGWHAGKEFGQRVVGEAQYRKLKTQFETDGKGDWVLMPPYPFHPNENLLSEIAGQPPHPPSPQHWMGTDDRGRDVFARLVHGFRISITFAIGVVTLAYLLGIAVGSTLGYFGGRVDIYGQRLVEIWAGLPFLYTIIIISSLIRPSMPILILLLGAFGWVGISLYMRGEFYREKSKDYVTAAIAQGEGSLSIMVRHLLPNSLTPVISFAPFAIVGAIGSLVALDFLGFGVPPPTPSWGELVNQGLSNITKWHLVLFPLGALFSTLLMVVFVGEAIREAFDPKIFSRLR